MMQIFGKYQKLKHFKKTTLAKIQKYSESVISLNLNEHYAGLQISGPKM